MDSKDAKTLNEHLKNLAKSNQQIADLIVELGRNAAKAQHPAYTSIPDMDLASDIQVSLDFADVPITGVANVIRTVGGVAKIEILVNEDQTGVFLDSVERLPVEALLISATDPE